jgi:ATP-binding cassette subfamily B protein
VTGQKISLFRLIISFFIREKFKVISLILLCMLWGVIPAINSLLLKNLVDDVSNDIPNLQDKITNILLTWGIIYFFWWELINLLGRLYDYIYLNTLPTIMANVVEYLANHTKFHSQKFFNQHNVGDITQKISLASLAIEELFAILIERILLKIFLIISSALTFYYVNSILCWIFLVWVATFLAVCFLTGRKSNKLSTEYASKYNKLVGVIVDTLSNISTVRMFSGYKNEEKHLGKYIKDFSSKYQNLQIFMTKIRYVQSLSCSIMLISMIYAISNDKNITPGDYALIIGLCTVITDYIRDLIQEISDMYEKFGVFKQSQELLTPHEIKDKKDAENLIIKQGKIEYKKVYFQYQLNTYLFSNKSIIIEGKQKVGLVGFSGSGKTTFANLITRIYQINEGEILIDGQNINDVTLESLRNSTSIIPQNPILFNRTIAENLKYSINSTDEEMVEAAKKAHIHEFITSLPNGYNTNCGFQGNLLSGGQKQRIAIARAILKNAPILILDEATSSLDSITEEQIQDSLKFLMQDKTVLVIAHKLSTLLNMGRILVFDNGRIVEDGIHQELLDNGKLYSKFWNSQVRV